MGDLISVIIPVYNTEAYLEKCLLSVQNQTYENLEIIVVDDGSTDKSGEICDAFAKKDGRFRVIHQKNAGQAAARNAGIREAAGKYTGFVDSDDYIEPEMFEEMYYAAECSGGYIAMCGYRNFGKLEGEYPGEFDELARDEAVKLLVEDRKIRSYLWDKLFLSSLFEGIEFPAGKLYEDFAVMHLLFLRTNKIKMVGRVLYHYRIRTDSTTDAMMAGNYRDLLDALDKRGNDLKNTLFYKNAGNVQIQWMRVILLNLKSMGKNRNDYYEELRVKIKKVLKRDGMLLNKKEVLKTGMALMAPGLFSGMRLWKKKFGRGQRIFFRRNTGRNASDPGL